MYLHPTYAVTPEREPLGLLDAWMWARNFKDGEGERAQVGESTRWIEGYERVAELAAALPNTRLVYVADRESDIIALMLSAQDLGTPADWLVRSQHNRALPEGDNLWERLTSGTTLGEMAFRLNDVIRLMAGLGGFLGRKGDGEPGVKTIWLGLQRVTDFAAGLRHAREFGEL
ncbi:transposase IS4 family protein [Azoarcus sp. CIB]|nr:transposase IS4 family protein [Azoarcus sp. CIB]